LDSEQESDAIQAAEEEGAATFAAVAFSPMPPPPPRKRGSIALAAFASSPTPPPLSRKRGTTAHAVVAFRPSPPPPPWKKGDTAPAAVAALRLMTFLLISLTLPLSATVITTIPMTMRSQNLMGFAALAALAAVAPNPTPKRRTADFALVAPSLTPPLLLPRKRGPRPHPVQRHRLRR